MTQFYIWGEGMMPFWQRPFTFTPSFDSLFPLWSPHFDSLFPPCSPPSTPLSLLTPPFSTARYKCICKAMAGNENSLNFHSLSLGDPVARGASLLPWVKYSGILPPPIFPGWVPSSHWVGITFLTALWLCFDVCNLDRDVYVKPWQGMKILSIFIP